MSKPYTGFVKSVLSLCSWCHSSDIIRYSPWPFHVCAEYKSPIVKLTFITTSEVTASRSDESQCTLLFIDQIPQHRLIWVSSCNIWSETFPNQIYQQDRKWSTGKFLYLGCRYFIPLHMLLTIPGEVETLGLPKSS